MCCLFGLLDYGNVWTAKQKEKILSVLATECEERGIDATGISYNSNGQMHIYKQSRHLKQKHLLRQSQYRTLGQIQADRDMMWVTVFVI